MATTAERMRAHTGPAILSYGFRPFFLLGAIWAALVVAIWLPMLAGSLDLPSAFSPLEWHVHELVYGYVPAIVAGFLLTAVPNWTGRLPVTGTPLLLLVAPLGQPAAWRSFSQAASAWRPQRSSTCSFSPRLPASSRARSLPDSNLRNLKVLVSRRPAVHRQCRVSLGSDLDARRRRLRHAHRHRRRCPADHADRRPHRAKLHAQLARARSGRVACRRRSTVSMRSQSQPAPWRSPAGSPIRKRGRPRRWRRWPALLHAMRLARWAGYRTAAEPLVLVLHVAYAFVPIGFLSWPLAIAAPGLVVATGALHGWTVGAVGTMTLAVMTRASLGHTGQALVASPSTQLIYAAIVIAAVARVVTASTSGAKPLLTISAARLGVGVRRLCVELRPLARQTPCRHVSACLGLEPGSC